MPETTHTPSTAAGLLAAVRPYRPAVEGSELLFDTDPPADLDAALRVLHTGVRALVAGKRWHGCDSSTGRVAELNPAAPIPHGVTVLCVEGDGRWDRLSPPGRIDQRRSRR